MKTIHIVYSEELGEVEAVFDTEDNLIGAWSCNDASWREYFNSFLMKLDIKVITGKGPSKNQLKKMKERFGEN